MPLYFVIRESVFLDLEPTMISDEELRDYRLYKVMKSGQGDVDDDELTEADMTEPLFMTEEITRQGVIINNNVFLSNEQFHTIRRLSEDMYSCTVCMFQCDDLALGPHMSAKDHAMKLEAHKPLKRFDLCIIRKINENFHCGVCNSIFPITTYRDHENSKSHGENLLFAINKVSDIMWEHQENKTSQYFCSNNIRAPNNEPAQKKKSESAGNNSELNARSTSERSESGRNSVKSELECLHSELNARITSERSDDVNLVNSELDGSHLELNARSTPERSESGRSSSNSGSVEKGKISDYDGFWMEVKTDINNRRAKNDPNKMAPENIPGGNFSYSYADRSEHNISFESITYNNIKIYEEDEIEEYTPPIEGVSYASMASKPVLEVPKFLKIDLGSKEVRVKFESWNMIIPTNANEWYCMLCMKSFLVRFKNKHCIEDEHKWILSNCAVVGAFEDYLIRDVSDKFYHCGHCNNLQYKTDMQVHVKKHHPVKNAKNIAENNLKLPAIELNAQPKIDKSIEEHIGNTSVARELDIFGNFTFRPFGAEITVSNLACHTIMLVNDKYLCAICDVYVQGDLKKHVFEAKHMMLINRTPFIRPFQCNLTRVVRGSLHCAICNILVPVNAINDHNIEVTHTDLMARALGMVKKKRPERELKYRREELGEFNNDLERFLSTLPSNTREALSQIKIKNHMGEMFQRSASSSSSNSTPTTTSINNSPTHHTYPLKGVNSDPNYPGKPCYPKSGAGGINPKISPKNGGGIPSPNIGVEENRAFLPQMLTVSMIESKLTGRPGSPITNMPIDYNNRHGIKNIDLPNRHGIENIDLKRSKRQGIENIDVKSNPDLRRDKPNKELTGRLEDIGVDNDLLSLDNQPRQMVSEHQKIEKNSEIIKGNKKETRIKGQEKPTVETNKTERRSESVESDEETEFNLEETVLLKLKSSYFMVTASSYHTLVHTSEGGHECVTCSRRLAACELRRHVRTRAHLKHLTANHLLHQYCGQLLRQIYLVYHCAICNVTMSRKEIRIHLEWPTHLRKYDLASRKLSKKVLKDTLKYAKEICVETQKEVIYNMAEPTVHIVCYVQSAEGDNTENYSERKIEKKSQMIMLKGRMMKIGFESWHGIVTNKNGVKCILCHQNLTQDSLQRHLETKYHSVALGITFDKNYYPTLIRKINEDTVNCVICNLELINNDSQIFEHINGRKHEKNYVKIIEKTTRTDFYSDCYQFPITL